MDIVIINGLPRAGKDTFVELCGEFCECANVSTIEPAKEALKMLGWNGEKTPEIRKFLSDVKDMAEQCFHTSERYLDEVLPPLKNIVDIVFIHCREPQQIDALCAKYNAITLYINADCRLKLNKNDLTNHADRDVANYNYDLTIYNNEDLDALRAQAKTFIEQLNLIKRRLSLS